MQPECENAIDDIVNESIVYDPDSHTAEINLDAVEVSDAIKLKIHEEFMNIKDLLDFERQAYEIFRHWYIDGRMYYHVIIDEKNVQDGIQELRFIDPRKIRKVREVKKKRSGTGPNTIQLAQTKQELAKTVKRKSKHYQKIKQQLTKTKQTLNKNYQQLSKN